MFPRYYILDANGEPQAVDDVMVWAEWFETARRHVAETFVPEDVPRLHVSTVFLGLDHQYGDGPPILWETMIFAGEEDPEIAHSERYTSREAAVKGHLRAVAIAK